MRDLAKRFERQLRRSRWVLWMTLPLGAVAAVGMMEHVQPVLRLIYIVAGFSLIIFLHELGHFVVARACSVKCLAFSIGIGPRLCGWRSGGKFSIGNDPYDPETIKKKAKDSVERAAVMSAEGAATQSDMPQSAQEPRHPGSVGDCDYRVSWLPLGGYVRMLGQDDMDPTKVSEDPHAFNKRPIWQRMCIVSAGVIMNLIFAAVCFSIIFSPGIGVDFPPAVLGSVMYDSPAWKAGLRPGDKILSIDNEKPRGFLEFTDIQMYSALSTGTDKLKFEVEHAATGKVDTMEILPTRSEQTGFLAIGVESMPGLKIVGSGDDFKKVFDDAQKTGDKLPDWMMANKEVLLKLRNGDKIVKADGTDIHDTYLELYNHVQGNTDKPVELTLTNTKDASLPVQTLAMKPHLEYLPGVGEFPRVLGLTPRLIVAGVQEKSPAAVKGIKPDDHIIRVGDRSYPTSKEMIAIITASGGNPVEITVQRAGSNGQMETKTFSVPPKLVNGNYRIGVGPEQDLKTLTFIPPEGDSAVAAWPVDTTIASIDGETVTGWDDVYRVLRGKSPGELKVGFKSGAGETTQALAFTAEEKTAVTERLHYQLGVHLEILTRTQVASNAGQAILMGMDHTKKFIINVYMTLAGLFRRTVDASNLHGIVGITKVGYDVQERGIVWLWYVLAMVSVNLAVANFLPLPIVDGGLFLLLILEKIRGKPLSLKVQTAIQTVGIVLLAGLFLFVTYNDITGLILK